MSGEARDVTYDNSQSGLDAFDVQEAIDALATRAAEPGPPGEPGQDGIDGQDGLDGHDGVDGKDGEAGQDGRDGTDGETGAPGRDGKPGADGAKGADGARGGNGLDGLNGSDGADGAGLPPGGLRGQIPVKRSKRDYDIAWRDAPKDGAAGAFTLWNAGATQSTGVASACLSIVAAPNGLTIAAEACGTVFTN